VHIVDGDVGKQRSTLSRTLTEVNCIFIGHRVNLRTQICVVIHALISDIAFNVSSAFQP